ncbi:MAG: hypothetical protein ACRCYU_22150 [Nocardioides sp.]
MITAFVSGPTTQTWPLVVFASPRFGLSPAINAVSATVLLVTLTGLLASALLLRRSYLRRNRIRA